MEADWTAIKNEYITTDIPQRKLAEKHGVSYSLLAKHCNREGWVKLREQSKSKADAKLVRTAADIRARRGDRFKEAVDLLLEKTYKATQQVEVDGVVDTDKLRKVGATLKDIKDMMGVKSDEDLQEQMARIRNLEKQAEADAPKEPMRIILEGADDICL